MRTLVIEGIGAFIVVEGGHIFLGLEVFLIGVLMSVFYETLSL